ARRRGPRAREIAGAVRARRAALALLPREARGSRAPRGDPQRARRDQARAGDARERRRDGRSRTVTLLPREAPRGADALRDWLDARRGDVDVALERYLPAAPACPPRVGEAMRYSLFGGGKRLRPVLALAAAEAVALANAVDPGAARAAALPVACALELIHTYSLVHDDLPAMDDDTLRRGRPTSHVVFGEGLAILAGDGLLTEAFALMAREPAVDADATLVTRKVRAIRIVADAAGAWGMVGGQAMDLDAAGSGARFDGDGLRAMHARKTGALIRASAAAGAVLAGASDGQLDATERFASELGLAFQIVDDILDVEGASVE